MSSTRADARTPPPVQITQTQKMTHKRVRANACPQARGAGDGGESGALRT